jgi:hypothetical protein
MGGMKMGLAAIKSTLPLVALAGSEGTAKILKAGLVDDGQTRSGVVGVNDQLHVVYVRTFEHL